MYRILISCIELYPINGFLDRVYLFIFILMLENTNTLTMFCIGNWIFGKIQVARTDGKKSINHYFCCAKNELRQSSLCIECGTHQASILIVVLSSAIHTCQPMYLPSGSDKITIFSANASGGGFRNLLQSRRSCPVLPECTEEWVKWRLYQASFVIIVLSVGKDSEDITTLEDSTNALVLLIKMYFL